MVRLNKIYTRQGDGGMTSLAGGQKIKKNAKRIIAYGTVDELNSNLGVVLTGKMFDKIPDDFFDKIKRIRNELFNLGTTLAVLPNDRRENTPEITMDNIELLEREMDLMNERLSPLNSFLLPGGCYTASYLHVARAVCRRCEQMIVDLNFEEPLDGLEIAYINRLSDWLFVAARYANFLTGTEEQLWQY